MIQTFECVDEIPKCDHSNESYWTVRSCGAVCYSIQGGSNFWVCEWNPQVWPFKWKLLSSTFLWCCLLCSTRFTRLSPWMKSQSVTIQMKAIKQYVPLMRSVILYKVVLTFESVDEIERCDPSRENYWAALSCGTFYYAVLGGWTFESVHWILKCNHSNESYQPVCSCGAVCYLVYKVVSTSESVDESWSVTIQMKATEQYVPMVLFILLYRVVLTSSPWMSPKVWPWKILT